MVTLTTDAQGERRGNIMSIFKKDTTGSVSIDIKLPKVDPAKKAAREAKREETRQWWADTQAKANQAGRVAYMKVMEEERAKQDKKFSERTAFETKAADKGITTGALRREERKAEKTKLAETKAANKAAEDALKSAKKLEAQQQKAEATVESKPIPKKGKLVATNSPNGIHFRSERETQKKEQ